MFWFNIWNVYYRFGIYSRSYIWKTTKWWGTTKKEKELKPEGVKNKYIDHVEAERLGDLARERERDRLQFEMFEDPTMNWSGHR